MCALLEQTRDYFGLELTDADTLTNKNMAEYEPGLYLQVFAVHRDDVRKCFRFRIHHLKTGKKSSPDWNSPGEDALQVDYVQYTATRDFVLGEIYVLTILADDLATAAEKPSSEWENYLQIMFRYAMLCLRTQGIISKGISAGQKLNFWRKKRLGLSSSIEYTG